MEHPSKIEQNSSINRTNATFAERLRLLMEGTYIARPNKISQGMMAEHIGISRQAVNQYCTGATIPSLEVLIKIADYFNVTTDYLLGRTQDPSPNPTATDELDLSPAAIQNIQLAKKFGIDRFLSNNGILSLFLQIQDITEAIYAEYLNSKDEDPDYYGGDITEDLESILEYHRPDLKRRIRVLIADDAIEAFKKEALEEFSSILDEITQYTPSEKDK